MNRIGIVCALHSEASCFTHGKIPAQQPVELNDGALLIVSGMGRARAQRAARQLAETGADCLISFGTAGALAPALRPGDLALALEVSEAGENHAACASLPAAVMARLSRTGVTVHSGPLAGAAAPIATADGKRRLYEKTGAMAVDMETTGVLDAARRSGLPAVALRVILDAAQVGLPDCVLRRVDEFGRVNVPGLAGDLARAPGQIPGVVRLACAARRAGKTMELVAQALTPDAPRARHYRILPAC